MEKKPYEAPKLTEYGNISEKTLHHKDWHQQGPGWKKDDELDAVVPAFS